MLSLTVKCASAFALTLLTSVHAQTAVSSAATPTSSGGFVGYNLTLEGDGDSAVYATDNTNTDQITKQNADVFLNASVSIGEIHVEVDNLTAKINLDLQVLKLLQFNAGVDLSIDRVNLLIQNVSAKVLLEARLENVLAMVDDALSSIDLNPVIATLGQDLGTIVNSTTGALTGATGSATSSTQTKRSFDLDNNILYSVNNYEGDAHTNRIFAQNGDIVEQELDNEGKVSSSRVVGSYKSDMSYNGHEDSQVRDGVLVQSLQYEYAPFHGLSVVAAVYLDDAGAVVGTQVLSEFEAGGSSTIADL